MSKKKKKKPNETAILLDQLNNKLEVVEEHWANTFAEMQRRVNDLNERMQVQRKMLDANQAQTDELAGLTRRHREENCDILERLPAVEGHTQALIDRLLIQQKIVQGQQEHLDRILKNLESLTVSVYSGFAAIPLPSRESVGNVYPPRKPGDIGGLHAPAPTDSATRSPVAQNAGRGPYPSEKG